MEAWSSKLIPGFRDLSYEERLKECGLTNTGDAKIKVKSKFFMILNDHENIDSNIFVKIKTGKRNGGHDFTLVKGKSRLDSGKKSFPRRTVNEWNKLSADCVHSSSINIFKNRIDNYLVRAGYTYISTCGLLISQRLPCMQPSDLLLGWQSC